MFRAIYFISSKMAKYYLKEKDMQSTSGDSKNNSVSHFMFKRNFWKHKFHSFDNPTVWYKKSFYAYYFLMIYISN